MASDSSQREGWFRWAGLGASLVVAAGAVSAQPATAPRSNIYSCVDASGKTLRSDRPIAECSTKVQKILNPDGSTRSLLPPTPTSEERAEAEARERELQARESEQKELARRDRNLVSLFPDVQKHNAARAKALDDVRNAVRASEARIVLLNNERKPLLEERAFYENKPLPTKLRTSLDANDASLQATQALIQNQQSEVIRINAFYDVQLQRLKKLWAGAPPGSLGPLGGNAVTTSSSVKPPQP